jgi:hypothetical protein
MAADAACNRKVKKQSAVAKRVQTDRAILFESLALFVFVDWLLSKPQRAQQTRCH